MSANPPHDPAARRAELLDAADRVIRALGPDASMTAIAAEAGITKPILYRHFGDKAGLYRALAERYAAPVFTELNDVLATLTDREQRMRVTIDTYLRFIESAPQLYRFLMHRALREQPGVASSIAAFTSVVAASIAEIITREVGLSAPQTRSARAWAHGIVGVVQLTGDWWLETGEMTREEVVDHIAALLWGGLSQLNPDNPELWNLVE